MAEQEQDERRGEEGIAWSLAVPPPVVPASSEVVFSGGAAMRLTLGAEGGDAPRGD